MINRVKHFLCLIWNDLISFIYPSACLLCNDRQESSELLCKICNEKIQRQANIVLENKPIHFQHLDTNLVFDGIFHFWEYSSDIQSLIHHLKYHHGKKLGQLLGVQMAALWTQTTDLPKIDLIIPIPLHSVRKRERGFNQSEIIANALSDHFGYTSISDGLIRTRYTKTQTRLSAEQRQRNLENVFDIKNPDCIKGQNILLVDDVSTTGATMNAAAETLKKKGAGKIYGCTIARPTLRESVLTENILYQ